MSFFRQFVPLTAVHNNKHKVLNGIPDRLAYCFFESLFGPNL